MAVDAQPAYFTLQALRDLKYPEGDKHAGKSFYSALDSRLQTVKYASSTAGMFADIFSQTGTVLKNEAKASLEGQQFYEVMADIVAQFQTLSVAQFDADSAFVVKDKHGDVLGLSTAKLKAALETGYSYFTEDGYGATIRGEIAQAYQILGFGELSCPVVEDKNEMLVRMQNFVHLVEKPEIIDAPELQASHPSHEGRAMPACMTAAKKSK